ncbi:aminopeptidase P family protein [Clostridia bacterium OttesenSCG-928-F22]|nr:aminopeptidase P family protein [Clostridia bacterium OttesenSCG-928-F22]
MKVQALRDDITQMGLDAYLASRPANIRYFSGFTGSTATLLLTKNKSFILSDFRYQEQFARQCPGFTYVESNDHMATAADLVTQLSLHAVGYEADTLTVKEYQRLTALCRAEFKPAQQVAYRLRRYKTKEEVASISAAADIACAAFEQLLGFIEPGKKETAIAAELEYYMRKLGAQGLAFPTIVASGENSALPHHSPGERILQKGDFIVIDFGCKVDGYCSDMTRTVALGHATDEMKRVYDTVLEAQRRAFEKLGKTVSANEIDDAARGYINAQGYEGCFGHGLGHGIGLEEHEAPRISKGVEDDILPGIVTSIEPGVYLAGKFGVRIEDICLVVEGGYENLVHTNKDLLIL